MADEDEENEWRFGLDDLEDDDSAADTAETEAGEDSNAATDVVGGVGADQPIEPGSPRIENVVFVVLGAILAVVVVADFLSLAGL